MNNRLSIIVAVALVLFATLACQFGGQTIDFGGSAEPTAVVPASNPTAVPVVSDGSNEGGLSACTSSDLVAYHYGTWGWADDAYLPSPNPLNFLVAWRPWQTENKVANLVWLINYLDPKSNGEVTWHVADAYVIKGEGNGIMSVTIALDNRWLEQLTDRGETGKDPYDTACRNDYSGQCKLNNNRMSLYLDSGKYSVLDADGTWVDMMGGDNWRQVLLPEKGSPEAFQLVFNLHEGGNFRFHIGGAENDGNGGWHSQIILPDASACR